MNFTTELDFEVFAVLRLVVNGLLIVGMIADGLFPIGLTEN
jgi:hypothetical protein